MSQRTRGHNTPMQGEGFAYSLDGVNWIDFTDSNTNGWEHYVNYGANRQAWHTVNYGWSAWLNLNTPIEARLLRFKWDGDSDALHELELSFQPQEHCRPTLTGDQIGEGGAAHILGYDGALASYFQSRYNNWQYIQVDFNCIGTFSAIRRYMSRDGEDIAGNRGRYTPWQGEAVAYSLDGITWTSLTGRDTNGWENYVNYGASLQAWHTLNYGWSAWLNLNAPVQARYVRFHWDGDADALNELEFSMRH